MVLDLQKSVHVKSENYRVYEVCFVLCGVCGACSICIVFVILSLLILLWCTEMPNNTLPMLKLQPRINSGVFHCDVHAPYAVMLLLDLHREFIWI